MSLDFTDDQSTWVQVMAWCRQATSHYLSPWWPRSMRQMVSLGLNELTNLLYAKFSILYLLNFQSFIHIHWIFNLLCIKFSILYMLNLQSFIHWIFNPLFTKFSIPYTLNFESFICSIFNSLYVKYPIFYMLNFLHIHFVMCWII